MDFLFDAPLLVLVPVLAMAADIGLKWGFFDEAPYDSAADISLAGLVFTGVHLAGSHLRPEPTPNEAMGWLFFQLLLWVLCLVWAKRLKKQVYPIGRWERLLSWVVGAFGFMWSTGKVLTLAP